MACSSYNHIKLHTNPSQKVPVGASSLSLSPDRAGIAAATGLDAK